MKRLVKPVEAKKRQCELEGSLKKLERELELADSGRRRLAEKVEE